MNPFIFENWHGWNGGMSYLLSDEKNKKLHSFKTIDDAINWLFISGYKEAARALNKSKGNDNV